MNAKTAHELEAQARQLGNAYLPGAQAALHHYTKLFSSAEGEERTGAGREAVYSEALDQLCRLHALIRKGRAYLQTRLDDPELAPETDTGIAAWLGHAWQLRELKAAGLVEENVELVQLAFHSYDDVARKEYVDAGVWMNLGTGRIYLTQTFRPYQAARHIKSDDSFSQVAQIKELCVYPGDINPRVRWDGDARPADRAPGPREDPRTRARRVRRRGQGREIGPEEPAGGQVPDLCPELPAHRRGREGAGRRGPDRRTPGHHRRGPARGAAQQSSAVARAERRLAGSNPDRPLPARPRQPQAAGQAAEPS